MVLILPTLSGVTSILTDYNLEANLTASDVGVTCLLIPNPYVNFQA